MTRTRRLLVWGAASLAVVLVASAIVMGLKADNHPTIRAKAITPLTYLTGLGFRGYESYMYVAVDKGYFRDAGLDVKIQSGAATEDNIKVLMGGRVDFAVVDVSGAFVHYSQNRAEYARPGADRPMVVAAIHQDTLACMMALPGHGITEPKDLAGKRIGYQEGGVIKTLFASYAKLAGNFDTSKIKWVSLPATALVTTLAAGKVDAVTQFVVGTPGVQKAANGKIPVVLPYSRWLSDLYGNGLAVSSKTARERPDVVRRFRDAMLLGLRYAADHPDEAGQVFHKYHPEYPAQTAEAETALLKPYVTPIGQIDEAKTAQSIALLQSVGAIQPGVLPGDVVDFGLAPRP